MEERGGGGGAQEAQGGLARIDSGRVDFNRPTLVPLDVKYSNMSEQASMLAESRTDCPACQVLCDARPRGSSSCPGAVLGLWAGVSCGTLFPGSCSGAGDCKWLHGPFFPRVVCICSLPSRRRPRRSTITHLSVSFAFRVPPAINRTLASHFRTA